MKSSVDDYCWIDNILPQLWCVNGLGTIDRVARPVRGGVNYCLLVDDFVVRFNLLGPEVSRFQSEVLAYGRLESTEVPAPRVVAYDPSRRFVPHEYLITTRIPGEPVVDRWRGLTIMERVSIAHAIGRNLATIHQQQFPTFGKLRDLDTGGVARWYDYVADFFQRYADQAIGLGVINSFGKDRLASILARHRPMLDSITGGSLVHSDYHFENILEFRGHITGIIDFEWAFSGDPAWDFIAEDEWEVMCPGSRVPIYEGYVEHSPLDETHHRRVSLYKLLSDLEYLVRRIRERAQVQYADTRARLFTRLTWLEKGE